MERWCLLITKKFLFFELFSDGKYRFFFGPNADGKMVVTWSFWAFHDTPGLRKYDFSCSVNNFEWMKYPSQFNEDFIKNYNDEIDEGYFLEVDVEYLAKWHELHIDLPFLPERTKI